MHQRPCTSAYLIWQGVCLPSIQHLFSNILTLQIVLWTSGIVVLSLLINAPLIPLLLRLTGLCDISAIKVKHLSLLRILY